MRLRTWAITGVAGVVGAGLAWQAARPAPRPGRVVAVGASSDAVAIADAIDERASIEALTTATGDGRAKALLVLAARIDSKDAGDGWIDVVPGLRNGFGKFGPAGRATTLTLAGKILARAAQPPVAADWSNVLTPTRTLFSAGMSDADSGVRAEAVRQVGALWTWMPDRTFLPIEEDALATWKAGLHAEVVRHVADPAPAVRGAVAGCLAALPLDEKAAPGVALIRDPEVFVRAKAMLAYAARPDLLGVEEVLPLLYDRPEVANVAGIVLKTRGLSTDQIALAKRLASPRVDVRSSAIGMLSGRDDIDPTVWLLYLSRDTDDSIRTQVASALALHRGPEASRRLREMAQADPSPAVRSAARLAAPDDPTTASLPPLPGSSGLTPRAN